MTMGTHPMADAGHPTVQPLIGRGVVRHERLRPVRHAFRYPSWFLMLPLRSLRGGSVPGLARNRAGLVSFHDSDHGESGDDALAWFEALLAEHGIANADGEIWLQTYPRVLGWAFRPVSFWYAHAADGRLVAVLAEVNNTFGERHGYLLHGESLRWGAEVQARKVFHVSPFCRVAGSYRFRFLRTGDGTQPGSHQLVRIDHDDTDGPLLRTSVGGALQPLTRAALARAVLTMPLAVSAVILRIHWQALRLWLKRVPFLRKPSPPPSWITPADAAGASVGPAAAREPSAGAVAR